VKGAFLRRRRRSGTRREPGKRLQIPLRRRHSSQLDLL